MQKRSRTIAAIFSAGVLGAGILGGAAMAAVPANTISSGSTGTPLPVSVVDALEAGLLAISIDEARKTRSVVDMAPIWRQFDAALAGKVQKGAA